MEDYEAIDICGHASADPSEFGERPVAECGDVKLRGIPFLVGDPADPEAPLIVFGLALRDESLRIVIDRAAQPVSFAHLLLDTRIREGGPVGDHIADYVFEPEGSDPVTVAIWPVRASLRARLPRSRRHRMVAE